MNEPNWILSENWAVSIDPMNWKIYQRSRNKDGEPSAWKVVGYYPTLGMLIKGLQQRMLLVDSGNAGLVTHVENVIGLHERAVSSLAEQIKGLGSEVSRMPPGVAQEWFKVKVA